MHSGMLRSYGSYGIGALVACYRLAVLVACWLIRRWCSVMSPADEVLVLHRCDLPGRSLLTGVSGRC